VHPSTRRSTMSAQLNRRAVLAGAATATVAPALRSLLKALALPPQ
jgi:hypothetical protein